MVALVAEQTGYPPELLDLDLDLEADLGIDTVKQAELFAQVRETYGIARDDSLKLRDYPTLNHVIGFVRDRTPQHRDRRSAASADSSRRDAEPRTGRDYPSTTPGSHAACRYRSCARRWTGSRRPACNWLTGSRVVVLPDTGGVAEALTAKLADRGVEVLTVDMTTDSETLAGQLTDWLAAGPIEGLFALAALDNERPIADLDIDWWHEGLRRRVKLLAAAARVLYDRLDEAGSFVVTATRNGGAHGYDEAGARSAMAGAVSGFTKALARERPAAIGQGRSTSRPTPGRTTWPAPSSTRRSATPASSRSAGGARSVSPSDWRRARLRPPTRPEPSRPDSVVVATGAAGSIVSAIVADLARAAGGGTFHLLDLIPEPDPADPDLARFADDRDGLKGELADRITQRGERATPVLIERELAAIERRCAAQAAIDAITAAGGTAHWYSADLRDGEAMGKAAAAIRAASERVDVLLHAGGLEISRLLPDKSPAEFDLVFDVKADGWFHLLHALGDVPIGAAVVFSSIAGRFGNGGQTDYSAANDLLCKSVSSFRTTRPGDTWDRHRLDGVGGHRHGQPRLDPEDDGVGRHRHAAAGDRDPGRPPGDHRWRHRWRDRRRRRPRRDARPRRDHGSSRRRRRHRPDGRAGRCRRRRWRRRRRPSSTRRPSRSCDDHRIEGTPVLPGVMGIEAFAEAARLLAPGWEVTAIEDVEFLAPFKWYRDEPRRVEVHVRAVPDGDRLVATCRLDGRRTLPGQPEQVTTHFTGRVVLSPTAADLGTMTPPRPPDGPSSRPDAIYRVYFHGPAYQVLAGVVARRRRHRRGTGHRPAGEQRPGSRAARRRPAPGRAVLPDRRRGRTGHRRHAWGCRGGSVACRSHRGPPRPPPAGRS